jgi:alkanesulfonate monooxygenase SsuD/methylene tetrahydromethanopterin reductase-like flavin-dependent oxidoreductase (luciferase family)
MVLSKSVRFGVVATDSYSALGWSSLAKRAESSGFDTLLVADHYANAMACTPLIVSAAAATETLRVGSYVYCNDFRHPAMLAKEVATMDVLSQGRIEFGLGAGWLKEEYDQVGLTFDEPRQRADRFEDAVALILRVLQGGTVHFQGSTSS